MLLSDVKPRLVVELSILILILFSVVPVIDPINALILSLLILVSFAPVTFPVLSVRYFIVLSPVIFSINANVSVDDDLSIFRFFTV